MSLVDHVSLPVPHSLVEDEIKLLTTALAPLGIKELFRPAPAVVALGPSMQNPFLWVTGLDENREPIPEAKEGGGLGKGVGVHLAFRANDREQVEAFHAAALKAGGKDNGAPGVRKEYHPGYYAAFVTDVAGHNLEAVVHEICDEKEGGKEGKEEGEAKGQ